MIIVVQIIMSNFHRREVMGRGSETQLGEEFDIFIVALYGLTVKSCGQFLKAHLLRKQTEASVDPTKQNLL